MNIVRSTLVLWLALYAVTGWAQVTSYSTTPASNNSSPPNGAPEAMAPSAVNDVLREIMADVAVEAQVNAVKVLASVSGTNTITGSMTPDLTAYSAGMIVVLTPAGNNTGATTININGLGAISIVKEGAVALIANDLVTTAPAILLMNGAATVFTLLNPQASLNGIATTDFARLSQSNAFTSSGGGSGAAIKLVAPTPVFLWQEDGASANNGIWDIVVDAENFRIRVLDDAMLVSSAFLTVDRTGTTADSINLQATEVQVNSVSVNDAAILTAGTLPVARGGTGVTSSTGTGSTVRSASPTITGTLTANQISADGVFLTGENFSIDSDGDPGAITFTVGVGSPEGSLIANVGSLYFNRSGGASTTLYVKTSGSSNTGWTAK